MLKKVTCIIAIFLNFLAVMSQEQPNLVGEHVSLGVRVGSSTLLINGSMSGQTHIGFGYGLDFGYTHYFSEHFGIHTGFSFLDMASGYLQNDVKSYPVTHDIYCDPETGAPLREIFHYYACNTNSVFEVYSAQFLEIPFQYAAHGKHWYAYGGVKFIHPIHWTATYTYGETQISQAYETELEARSATTEWATVLHKENGAYTVYGEQNAGFSLPFTVTCSLEGGYRLGCDCSRNWKIGAYLDFPFLCRTVNAPDYRYLVSIDVDGPYYNHVFTSNMIDKYKLLSFGLKVFCDFNIKSVEQ